MFANVEPLALELELPWQESQEQEKKFKELLKRILIALALFAIIIPWLPVFEPEYKEPEKELTKTKILLEPVIVEPEPVPQPPQPKPIPKPKPREVVQPTQKPVQVVENTPPPPKPVDKNTVMEEQGLAGLNSQLAALRGSLNVQKLQRKNVDKSDLGKVEHTTRDAFGEDIAAKRSEGIQVDDSVLREERAGLAAYRGVAVEASEYSDLPGGSSLSYLSAQAGRRDMENIRRTFEAAKSSVFSVYLQALNEKPDLAGKLVFRLIIEPDGSISELELVSSELGVRELEVVILEKIRNINFGAKEVSPTAVEYAFSFLPS